MGKGNGPIGSKYGLHKEYKSEIMQEMLSICTFLIFKLDSIILIQFSKGFIVPKGKE